MFHTRETTERRSQLFRDLCGNIAGLICFDWSSMGKMLRWLGPSSAPFWVWMRERAMAREDFTIAECVCGFDDKMLQSLLGERGYHSFTL